jgi:hypothetical protein
MDSERISPKSVQSAARSRASRSTAVTLGFLSILTLSVAGGCSDDFVGAEMVCHKGDTRECLGPGACQGAQECTATGSGFQPCKCGDGANQGGGGRGSDPTGGSSGANLGGTASTPRGGAAGADGGAPVVQGGAGGAVSEAGAGGATAPQYECSPIGNVGCSATQNCDLDTAEPTCVQAGTKPLTSICAATSECAPGLLCLFHNCVKACGTLADCKGADASSRCGVSIPFPKAGLPLVGGCVKDNCDVLTQDCPAGQTCYLGSCLTTAEPGGQGDACETFTECGKGLDCLLTNDSGDRGCGKYCDSTAQNPCGQGFDCGQLQGAIAGVPAKWGVCVSAQ